MISLLKCVAYKTREKRYQESRILELQLCLVGLGTL